MLKKLVAISVLFILTQGAHGQHKSHKIYLTNGSVLYGKIIEADSVATGIKTTSGNLWVFPNNEIQKIETVDHIQQFLKNGYHNYTAFGILPGASGNKNTAPFVISMEHHYQFKSHYSVGLKTGIELLNETVAPIAIDAKIIYPLRSFGIFAGAYTGYSFSLENPENEYEIKNSYGGITMGTDVGLLFPIATGNSMYISLGYRYNELKYKREDWYYGNVDRSIYFNRLQVKMGIILY